MYITEICNSYYIIFFEQQRQQKVTDWYILVSHEKRGCILCLGTVQTRYSPDSRNGSQEKTLGFVTNRKQSKSSRCGALFPLPVVLVRRREVAVYFSRVLDR